MSLMTFQTKPNTTSKQTTQVSTQPKHQTKPNQIHQVQMQVFDLRNDAIKACYNGGDKVPS